MTRTSLLTFLKQDFFNLKFVVYVIALALIYSLVALTLMNLELINSILKNALPLAQKFSIIGDILRESLSREPIFNLILNLTIAILFGINILLITQKLSAVSKQKNLSITFGAGFISIATTGCAACGFSILSLAGLGGIVATLPFHGLEITIAAAILLFLTAIYNMNSLYKTCEIRR